jgi:hypothetical protein
MPDEFLGEKDSYLAVAFPVAARPGQAMQLLAVRKTHEDAKRALEELMEQGRLPRKVAIVQIKEIFSPKAVVVLDEVHDFLDPLPAETVTGEPG